MKPLQHSVKAKRHSKQYQMHKYFARRPYNVFQNIIEHYSNEGDVVLDCFCGGGVTIYESVASGRVPIGVDINPLATFITKMQIYDGNLKDTGDLITEFVSSIRKKYLDLYRVEFDADKGVIEWTEYAYKTICPSCESQVILSENNKIRNGVYGCPNSKCENHSGVKRLDLMPDGIAPLRIKYKSDIDGEIRLREYSEAKTIVDINDYIDGLSFSFIPDIELPMDMDRQYEDRLFQKGVKYYKDLFTDRNFYINTMIYNDILDRKDLLDQKDLDILYFIFSSSLRYSNNMTRVTSNWEGGKPTSMDKHAFWLPSQFVENNIIKIIESRAKSIFSGLKYSKENLKYSVTQRYKFEELKTKGDYLILNKSASVLPVPDGSVDVVITDPPYGSNVQYSELSIIWNVWFQHYNSLETYLSRDKEAVVNRRLPKELGAKDTDFYEDMLYKIFKECYRVLKDEKYLVFTFNNKNINVWVSMLKAVNRAGFILPEKGVIYQDFIESYKNTAHLRYSGNLHGDFIYSFKKSNSVKTKDEKYKGFTLSEVIEKCVRDFSIKISSRNISITTTDLYQQLLVMLTQEIMLFLESVSADDIREDKLLSDQYIDQVLSEFLVFENDIWKAK